MPYACQKCQKAAATVHLTDIVNGEKRETHLCERCSLDAGFTLKLHEPLSKTILEDFVSGQASIQEMADLTCPHCGMTYAEYRRNGLLGCPNDYFAFAKALDPLIARAQGSPIQHVGKAPSRAPSDVRRQAELMRLRRKLDDAVGREDYEEAASLRDRLKALES